MTKNEVQSNEVTDIAQALERIKNSKDLIERDVAIMLGRIDVQHALVGEQGKTMPFQRRIR